MRIIIVFLLTLISAINLNAQNNERIINDMFFDLFGRHKDTIFIVREMSKPNFKFDSTIIEDKTGLKLSNSIIQEWERNINLYDSSIYWNEFELNNGYFKNLTFVGEKAALKCIEKNQIKTLNKKKRKVIYSTSKIVFDDKKENAIFRLLTYGQGVSIEETVLVKKIFEKWIIVGRFGWIIK